jgi:hypothetical protein
MKYVLHRDAMARHLAYEGTPDPDWEILPDHMDGTLAARASALLVTRRFEFIARPRRSRSLVPHWIVYGYELDPASEALLRAEIRRDIEQLRRKLAEYG